VGEEPEAEGLTLSVVPCIKGQEEVGCYQKESGGVSGTDKGRETTSH
jgi:hypothetical protein